MMWEESAEDVALLAACWRSIGLRSATVEWELDRPARLTDSLAMRLRSALGPALAAGGARSGTLTSIPGDGRPPALWFRGWDCPDRSVRRVRAGLRCVGAVEADWPALRRALARLRLPADGDGCLADAVACSVTWPGGEVNGGGFGPPVSAAGAFAVSGGACLVEALSPLHLTATQQMVSGPPDLPVLVRSAGERLHQVCLHWGESGQALPSIVGRAYRESLEGRLAWAEVTGFARVARQSASTGKRQVVRGVRGVFAYEDVGPLALKVLALGSELGVGRDVAFGCGLVRLSVAEGR
jgi:hypothetical protein